MDAAQITWWVCVVCFSLVALVAIVFAVLAFVESQVVKPYRNIVRHDVIAKGDLVVEGDAKLDSVDVERVMVQRDATMNRLKVKSLRVGEVFVLQETGSSATIQLTPQNTSYRVDQPDTAFELVLPLVSDCPGQLIHVSKSLLGGSSQVHLTVHTGDYMCAPGECFSWKTSPAVSLMQNQGDQIWLSNDSVNAWKVM